MTKNNKDTENQEKEIKIEECEEINEKKVIPTIPAHKTGPNFPNGNHFKWFHPNTMHAPQRQWRGAARGR